MGRRREGVKKKLLTAVSGTMVGGAAMRWRSYEVKLCAGHFGLRHLSAYAQHRVEYRTMEVKGVQVELLGYIDNF